MFAVFLHDDGESVDLCCGPLVLLGPVDDQGETLPLTDAALVAIRARLHPVGTDDPAVATALVEQATIAASAGFRVTSWKD